MYKITKFYVTNCIETIKLSSRTEFAIFIRDRWLLDNQKFRKISLKKIYYSKNKFIHVILDKKWIHNIFYTPLQPLLRPADVIALIPLTSSGNRYLICCPERNLMLSLGLASSLVLFYNMLLHYGPKIVNRIKIRAIFGPIYGVNSIVEERSSCLQHKYEVIIWYFTIICFK